MTVSAGAPSRLGQGHPNSAARHSDPPVTELARFSPKGRGADGLHPDQKGRGNKAPQADPWKPQGQVK